MRTTRFLCTILLPLLVSACTTSPTEKEITESLEAQLRSVNGDWVGISSVQNAIRLDFRLQEGANGQLSGSGTMKEANAAAAVPITVSGTFQRPALSLVFHGMVYEGRTVEGAVAGNYTSVGGISTTLQLSGQDYSRSISILLQEK